MGGVGFGFILNNGLSLIDQRRIRTSLPPQHQMFYRTFSFDFSLSFIWLHFSQLEKLLIVSYRRDYFLTTLYPGPLLQLVNNILCLSLCHSKLTNTSNNDATLCPMPFIPISCSQEVRGCQRARD